MFLSSDTDTDSEWDSDSSDLPHGPMKQALDVNLEDKSKYDFTTNLPETGDQFLLAVRRERKKTPKYIVADMDKIREHKNRKLAKLGKSPTGQEGASSSTATTKCEPSADATSSTLDDSLTSAVERLTLQPSTMPKVVTLDSEEKRDPALRYLPTDLWRHDRLSQFMYMRDKIDNLREMMQDGQFILLNSFGTSFSRDRTFWLRYCFGTDEATRMIDTRRAHSAKVLAKALYDEQKRLKLAHHARTSDDADDSLSSGDEEDEVSDENSDVELVSKEEVKTLELLDEIGIEAAEEEPNEISAENSDVEIVSKEEVKNLELLDQSGLDEEDEVSDENYKVEIVEKEDVVKSLQSLDEIAVEAEEQEEATKKGADLNKNGRDPTVHLLLSMPNKLIEFLLTLHLDWIKEFGFMSRRQGSWLYSLMNFIPEPVEPSIVSDLRAAVPSLVMRRDKAIQQIESLATESSTIMGQEEGEVQGKENEQEKKNESVEGEIVEDSAAPPVTTCETKQEEDEKPKEEIVEKEDPPLIESTQEKGEENTKDVIPGPSTDFKLDEFIKNAPDFDSHDELATCNLFISLVIDFFGQKDLSKFLTGADNLQY